jgi:POT family proton-dependent oligopeptide transporter
MTSAQTIVTRDRTFLGEPRALAYLAFTEAWERFSYYGMTALLVLYMSGQLFLPGNVEHVAGFASFRAVLEGLFGPMTPVALASQIFGLYTGFVYFTPVFGGIIADRWIGKRNAVVIGALLMSAGHIAMAFDQSFLMALVLLVVGCGLLKGNISAQVGALYRDGDGAGRTRGFAIFSTAINIGAVAGPLACGLLAQLYGWHAGFGLAGALMLIGLGTYLSGYRVLATETHDAASAAEVPAATGRSEGRVVWALLFVMFITIFQSIAYYQNSNIALVWINDHANLDLFGFAVPVAWFNSIDPFVSIVSVPVLFALWRWQQRHGGEPGELGKIATGAWICCAANLLLVIASWLPGRAHVLFPALYDVLLGVAFIYYWPTLLALVSLAAPRGLKSTLIGVVFLTLFISNITIGRLGGSYEKLGPTSFWMLHAAIAATGGVLALVFGRRLTRVLADGAAAAPGSDLLVTPESLVPGASS